MEEERGCRHCGLPVPGGRRGERSEFCCFGCRFAHHLAMPSAESVPKGGPASTLLLRLGLGIFLTLNIMVASWLSYSQELFGAEARAQGADAVLPALFSYLALFLCTLLIALLGLPLLADVARSIRRPGAQTLIVIGVFAAFVLSAVHTVRGEGSLYYDTAAVVLVIVALGSHLEAGAKRRAAASASRGLATLPRRVRVRHGEGTTETLAEQVRVGDVIQVRPGELLAVDAVVVEGTGHIEESSLTGESRPRVVASGDRLLAGCLSLDGQLWLRVEAVGDATVLAQMERSLAEARATRPEVQRLADRIAAVFVPGVMIIAAAVLVTRTAQGRPVFADAHPPEGTRSVVRFDRQDRHLCIGTPATAGCQSTANPARGWFLLTGIDLPGWASALADAMWLGGLAILLVVGPRGIARWLPPVVYVALWIGLPGDSAWLAGLLGLVAGVAGITLFDRWRDSARRPESV